LQNRSISNAATAGGAGLALLAILRQDHSESRAAIVPATGFDDAETPPEKTHNPLFHCRRVEPPRRAASVFIAPAFDLNLLKYINQDARCTLLDVLMPFASKPELATIVLVAALIFFLVRRTVRPAVYILWMALSLTAVDAGTHVVKDAFHRVRPLNSIPGAMYYEDSEWRRLPQDFVQTKERGSSYFSAHAANSMCLAVMALCFWRRLNPWILLLPLIVGYSRVYLAKHFPTDVLAGWAFGAVAGWGLSFVFFLGSRRLTALRAPAAVQGQPQKAGDQEQRNA
jgi:undecaprenyl-diphosphatase